MIPYRDKKENGGIEFILKPVNKQEQIGLFLHFFAQEYPPFFSRFPPHPQVSVFSRFPSQKKKYSLQQWYYLAFSLLLSKLWQMF